MAQKQVRLSEAAEKAIESIRERFKVKQSYYDREAFTSTKIVTLALQAFAKTPTRAEYKQRLEEMLEKLARQRLRMIEMSARQIALVEQWHADVTDSKIDKLTDDIIQLPGFENDDFR